MPTSVATEEGQRQLSTLRSYGLVATVNVTTSRAKYRIGSDVALDASIWWEISFTVMLHIVMETSLRTPLLLSLILAMGAAQVMIPAYTTGGISLAPSIHPLTSNNGAFFAKRPSRVDIKQTLFDQAGLRIALKPSLSLSPSAMLRAGPISASQSPAPQPVVVEDSRPDPKASVRRVVLAYSGGLDTSVICTWLKENYNCEVICFTANIGQGYDELIGLEEKALASGAKALVVQDLQDEFVSDYVWPCLRAGARYDRKYLLGTSMARPLIAKAMIDVANKYGADAIAHGCTGKGNDQVRFELVAATLNPSLKVIAPWREWDIRGREDAIDYAEARGISVQSSKSSLYSRDRNLFHLSHEGDRLESLSLEPVEEMFMMTISPQQAPDIEEYVTIGFKAGFPVSVNGRDYKPADLLRTVNAIGARHGIGRTDIVENRMVGMKSRGVYETPGGTILFEAAQEIDAMTMDSISLAMKDEEARRYSDLVYKGLWFHKARVASEAAIKQLTSHNDGEITMRLYKGSVNVVARTSPYSLYRQDIASFEDDIAGGYNQADAHGFIRLFSLSSRITGAVQPMSDSDY